MLALAVFLPGLVVAHDGALEAANKVASALHVELIAAPLSDPCVHDARCASRPRDQVVWLTPSDERIAIEIVDVDGSVIKRELVEANGVLDAIEL